MDILPLVVSAGTDVGVLTVPWFDIPKGTDYRFFRHTKYVFNPLIVSIILFRK